MYAVQPISARKVVDLGTDIEQMDLGSESDISDVKQSQVNLSLNMRTNDIKYV